MNKIRSDGVKENVDKLGGLLEMLVRSGEAVRSGCREMFAGDKARADSPVLEKKILERVAASETNVLNALEAISKRIDKQDMLISNLALESQNKGPGVGEISNDGPTARIATGDKLNSLQEALAGHGVKLDKVIECMDGDNKEKWTDVVRKSRGLRTKKTGGTDSVRPVTADAARPGIFPVDQPKKAPTKPVCSRPLAVMVSDDKEQFPELLSTIRRSVNPDVTGNSIARIRKTGTGKLLIEINGDAKAAESVKAEVERSLGPMARVRKLEDTSAVEIRDLDGMTTGDEVVRAAMEQTGEGVVRLVSIREVNGGARAAVVVLSKIAARRICAEGRLRVGLVYARVRQAELPARCFRCLAFGHLSRDCQGVDRSKRCWRCGVDGHFAKACGADEEARTAFRRILGGAGMTDDKSRP